MPDLAHTIRPIVRHAAISTLSAAYKVTGRSHRALKTPRVQVLLLHGIRAKLFPKFRSMLQSMLNDGVRFVSYSEACRKIEMGDIDDVYHSVTFDDGFESCVEAGTILKELGISACFFLNHSSIGLNNGEERDFFCRTRLGCESTPFMSWNQVEGLRAQNHEIGNHTGHHLKISAITPAQISEEIGDSRKTLTGRLGPIDHFAWPYGLFPDFSAEAANLVYATGHLTCASGQRGSHRTCTSAGTIRPCIRRDNWELDWPRSHFRYFMSHSAERAMSPEESWPREWRPLLDRPNPTITDDSSVFVDRGPGLDLGGRRVMNDCNKPL